MKDQSKTKQSIEAGNKPLDYAPESEAGLPIPSNITGQALQLYPNKNPNPATSYQISRKATDTFKGFLEGKNDPQKDREWKDGRASVTRKNGNAVSVIIDGKFTDWEDLRKEVIDRGDAVFIQTWNALWAFAHDQGHGYQFHGAKITDIMEYVFKKPKSGYFSQKEKKAFTERLYKLAGTRIAIDHEVNDGDKYTYRNGKKTPKTKNITSFFNFLKIEHAEHAAKNEDKTVMVKMWGELLPGINKGNHRGMNASRGIFELNANHDRTAILLGEHIKTRLDQIRQGQERTPRDGAPVMTYPLIDFISWSDLQTTWNQTASTAAKRLQKALDKLQEVGYFRAYTPEKMTSDPGQLVQIIGFRDDEQ